MVVVFILLSMFFWSLAAILNAVMDTLVHHFYSSIFYHNTWFLQREKFFNPDYQQYSYMLPYTKYKVDAWHLSKSLMIIFQATSNCFVFLAGVQLIPETSNVMLSIDVSISMIVLGIIWNLTFNLFYNKILIRK